MRLRTGVLYVLLGMLWAATARAQTTTASVRGTVIDDQRLPVPGATVTIQDTVHSVSRSATSDSHGLYEIAGLQPGDYHLTTTLAGFATTEIDVRLEVNERLQADIVLRRSEERRV